MYVHITHIPATFKVFGRAHDERKDSNNCSKSKMTRQTQINSELLETVTKRTGKNCIILIV